ncbi:uroporphyrinogen-III C-methyltransferase, partial [bacterium]|nr:uroporphyrinogen-III C-methyltransferase [bacterium]
DVAPALSNFIFPAIVDRSPLVIAISSGGASPVLARHVRSHIESTVPAAYGELADFIGEHRKAVAERLPEINQRRLFWEDVVQSEVAERVMMGRRDEAAALLLAKLNGQDACAGGEVYLIGAGPGDPDLMTFKALRLLQRADVVLYDRLVAPEIIDMARRDAEKIYVGKARANHAVPQGDINSLLVNLAQQGKKVARLKGGDPFVFGRGGEEIASLVDLGIPFQVVPGISAANGCACYAGIPLTHRDYAQSVRFLTGNLKNNRPDLPWAELAIANETLVIYMGLTALPTISEELIAHGRAGSTPIALVERGTTANQRVHVATLSTIVDVVASRDIHAPTLLIIGDVVKLQATLAWRD